MAPVVAEVTSENADTFAVARLDIDESNETVRKYRVRGTPTYIVFQDGKVVGRFAGAMPKGRFLQNILNAINN